MPNFTDTAQAIVAFVFFGESADSTAYENTQLPLPLE